MASISKSFKQLDLIFTAVLAAQILLALAFFILRDQNIVAPSLLEFEYLPIVVLIINTSTILFAKYFFTARNKIDKKIGLQEKFDKYKALSFIIILILDFANIINLTIYLLSGAQVYLLVSLLVLILYIVYRPSKIKFADSSLSSEEKHIIFSEQSD